MEYAGFREAIRTASVSYPIPFMLATFLAFALFCFGGAAALSGALFWVLIGCGVLCVLSGVAIALYAVLFKDHLLRSSREVTTARIVDGLLDGDMSQDQLRALTRALPILVDEKVTRHDSQINERGVGTGRKSDE
jgi:hypothetical protein